MPFNFLLNRYVWYFIGTAIIIGSVWYSLQTWHYAPLKERDAMLVVYGTKINNLEVDLIKCVDDSVVVEFESFFEGGGDVEGTNGSDSNIFLK